MVFYRIEGVAENIMGIESLGSERSRDEVREAARHLGIKADAFNLKQKDKSFIFLTEILESIVTMGVIMISEQDLRVVVDRFLGSMGITLREITYEETTFSNLKSMLFLAERRDFVSDEDEILRKLGLTALCDRISFEEELIEEASKNDVYQAAEKLISNEDVFCELDRIYQGKKGKRQIMGHPVHYILLSDHRKTAEEKSRVIMQALYANSRLRIKRVSMLELRVGRRGPAKRSYEALYKSSLGGAVQIMMFPTGDEEETDGFASVQREYIEAISEVIRKYRYQVLTIFCLPAESRSGYKLLREYLDQMTFIEMAEASVSRERALAYLKTIAGKHGVRVNASLKKMLVQDDGYYAGDLIRIFDTWYDAKLKRELYPQYSEMEIYGKNGKTREAKGLAYNELMEMEGIDEAKKLIKMAVECRKAQKVFAAAGMGEERFSMHMVFTGNPGTAKTTVARLFARSLKENGLVDSGVFIEAGRGDLVGKYVGWTAKNIQGKFKEAIGGVLFIDEAYSLLDGRSGSFGDEAINTIVQEMENHRESVIVIFAGYPDRMEEFLERNPGLRSRIAFHVPFPDYDAPQLTNIAGFTARKMGLNLSEDARDKLGGMFETARKNKNFGNGRYVRNVLEKARMKQMTRILEMGYEAVSSQEVNLIRACDIEVPETEAAETIRFGFCS